MKNIANNLFNIILVIALVVFSAFFIYKGYNSYKNYKIVQKSERTINLVKNLNTVIDNIEQEQANSAVYLGYGGKTDFNKLKTIRQTADKSIENTKLFIQNNPIFSNYTQLLNNVSSSLQYTRSRVDVVSDDYKSILFEYYQNEITKPILNIIKSNLQELALGLHTLDDYIYTYSNLIHFKNNVNKEKSFISYKLSNSTKMSNQDLEIWDKIIEEQIIPQYNGLDIKTVTQLHSYIDTQAFEQSNFNNRVEITKGILSGAYTINATNWLNTMDEKTDKIQNSENSLHEMLQEKTSNINASPKEALINISIALLFILLLFYMIHSIKKEKRAKKDFAKVKKRRRRTSDFIVDNDDMIDIRQHITKKPIQAKNQFNPTEEFETIISEFERKAEKKHISINHYIDPNIPTACVGNIKQIKQIISNLLNHAIGNTKSYGTIKVRIENSANKETESAIRFSVIESSGHISREYKNKIMKYFFNEELVKSSRISTKKTDLVTTGQLIANIDGILEISNSEKAGATISFAVSLKKVLPKKAVGLVA